MKENDALLRPYTLNTPVKDEEENLPNLIQSVVKQTVKPVLWVIVDDGSTDNTPKIIKNAKEKYSWIQSTRMNEGKRDLGLHLADVMRKGFDFAIEYCIKNGIKYHYLGNVDGDMILEYTFIENLIKEFEKNPKLGIASGGSKQIVGDRVIHTKASIDEPAGGHMLIRRKCFEECGGIPLSYASDSALKAKAKLRGWKTKRFEENIATGIRDMSSAEGYWKGYKNRGKASYYLNLNPLHVMIRSVIYSFRRPCYTGIAYMAGYLSDLRRKKEQIDDNEIKKYYWNKWKKIFMSYRRR